MGNSTSKKVLTGAEIIWECLLEEKVSVIFGYPGGAILPAYDALTKYKDLLIFLRGGADLGSGPELGAISEMADLSSMWKCYCIRINLSKLKNTWSLLIGSMHCCIAGEISCGNSPLCQ